MTKREYAQAIAELINGEMIEVEKANGVKMIGVTKKDGSNIRPNVYIDKMYKDKLSIREAAEMVEKIYEETPKIGMDVEIVKDWDQMKGRLKARLYNRKTNADIYRSAKEYGFEDFIIIPYIDVSDIVPNGYIQITDKLLKNWEHKADTVIDIALDNVKNDAEIIPMTKVLTEIMKANGFPQNEIDQMLYITDNKMNVITNKKRKCGAIGLITMRKKLKEKFPDGYIVLPSSIHEVIVIPYEEDLSETYLTDMVESVNNECIEDIEVLGDRAYIVKY